jgi:hypothetical protein
LDALRNDQESAAAFPVGIDTAEQRKKEDWDLGEERVQTQINRRIRELIDEPTLSRGLHPGAHAGCAGPEPHQPEIAIPEGFEDAIEQLFEGLRAIDQVQEISVGVFEEGEAISLYFIGLSFKFDPLLLQLVVSGIEVFNRDGDVTKSGCPHA